jgi:hypothetical protein
LDEDDVTMTNPYAKGDRIKIVKGVYKLFGKGTYVAPAGELSARVNVDGDIAKERTIRLKSIRPLESSSFSNRQQQQDNVLILVNREDLQRLVNDVQRLHRELENVTERLNDLLLT